MTGDAKRVVYHHYRAQHQRRPEWMEVLRCIRSGRDVVQLMVYLVEWTIKERNRPIVKAANLAFCTFAVLATLSAIVPMLADGTEHPVLIAADANGQPVRVADNGPSRSSVDTPRHALLESTTTTSTSTSTTTSTTPTTTTTTTTVKKPTPPPTPAPATPKPTGNSQSGGASFYTYKAGGCAHRTLPKGTKVNVVNATNGKTATCTVNDRGPFIAGRVIDLDITVFRQIANTSQGVVGVKISW